MSRSHFFLVAFFLAVIVAFCSAIPVEVKDPAVSAVVPANPAVENVRPKRQFLAGLLIGKALGAGYGYGLGRSAYYGGYGRYPHAYGHHGPYGGYGYGGHYYW
ncbi:cuticle protein 64-like [Daphnia carinata]|uniref:cuticle protein 64-like n=1 Tax=Daphnia carinata TaxID=120202 RepID=UPI00257B996E|nr:cuticle protein 64-like [Daphnia carinata]